MNSIACCACLSGARGQFCYKESKRSLRRRLEHLNAGAEFNIGSAGMNSDFLSGNVPLAKGIYGQQAYEAAKLYQQVKAVEDGNITFTGHSLGGGLASVMAVWFDRPAYVFAPAPFQNSADSTQEWFDFTLRNDTVMKQVQDKLRANGNQCERFRGKEVAIDSVVTCACQSMAGSQFGCKKLKRCIRRRPERSNITTIHERSIRSAWHKPPEKHAGLASERSGTQTNSSGAGSDMIFTGLGRDIIEGGEGDDFIMSVGLAMLASNQSEDPANQTPADANWVRAGMGGWGQYNDAQNGDLGGRLSTYGLSAHQYVRETGGSAIGDDIVDAGAGNDEQISATNIAATNYHHTSTIDRFDCKNCRNRANNRYSRWGLKHSNAKTANARSMWHAVHKSLGRRMDGVRRSSGIRTDIQEREVSQ